MPKGKRQKRIDDQSFWLSAVNLVLIRIWQKHVDENGIGVFSLSEVLKDLEINGIKLSSKFSSIRNYLHYSGVIVKLDKQPNGKFSYRVTKKKLTARDMEKSRAKLNEITNHNRASSKKKLTATKASIPTSATVEADKPKQGIPVDIISWASDVQRQLEEAISLVKRLRNEVAEVEKLLSNKREELAQAENTLDKLTEEVEKVTSSLSYSRS